jgi:hypothetical protein
MMQVSIRNAAPQGIKFPGHAACRAHVFELVCNALCIRLAAEIEAGREEAPPEEKPSPGVSVSLGEAGDADLAGLAAMAQGLAGTGFAGHKAADVMPPGIRRRT